MRTTSFVFSVLTTSLIAHRCCLGEPNHDQRSLATPTSHSSTSAIATEEQHSSLLPLPPLPSKPNDDTSSSTSSPEGGHLKVFTLYNKLPVPVKTSVAYNYTQRFINVPKGMDTVSDVRLEEHILDVGDKREYNLGEYRYATWEVIHIRLEAERPVSGGPARDPGLPMPSAGGGGRRGGGIKEEAAELSTTAVGNRGGRRGGSKENELQPVEEGPKRNPEIPMPNIDTPEVNQNEFRALPVSYSFPFIFKTKAHTMLAVTYEEKASVITEEDFRILSLDTMTDAEAAREDESINNRSSSAAAAAASTNPRTGDTTSSPINQAASNGSSPSNTSTTAMSPNNTATNNASNQAASSSPITTSPSNTTTATDQAAPEPLPPVSVSDPGPIPGVIQPSIDQQPPQPPVRATPRPATVPRASPASQSASPPFIHRPNPIDESHVGQMAPSSQPEIASTSPAASPQPLPAAVAEQQDSAATTTSSTSPHAPPPRLRHV